MITEAKSDSANTVVACHWAKNRRPWIVSAHPAIVALQGVSGRIAIESTVAKLVAMPKDRLVSAGYQQPSSIRMVFADGLAAVRSFAELHLDMTNMKASTIRSSACGDAMEVTSKWNDRVEVDASSLRAAIDPDYAAELERAFLNARGPIDKLRASGASLPQK